MTRKTKRLAFISWLIDSPYRARNHATFIKSEMRERNQEFQLLILGIVLIYIGVQWTINSLLILDIKRIMTGGVFNLLGIYLLDTSVYLDQKRK